MWLQDCEDDGETHAGGRVMHLLQVSICMLAYNHDGPKCSTSCPKDDITEFPLLWRWSTFTPIACSMERHGDRSLISEVSHFHFVGIEECWIHNGPSIAASCGFCIQLAFHLAAWMAPCPCVSASACFSGCLFSVAEQCFPQPFFIVVHYPQCANSCLQRQGAQSVKWSRCVS